MTDHRAPARTRRRNLPRTGFQAAVVPSWEGALVPCIHLWGAYALSDPILDSTPLKRADWAHLFAYMHRRFGLPNLPSDGFKDLSAAWLLTTPDPGVFLEVRPSLTGPGFSFLPKIPVLDEGIRSEARRDEYTPERVAEIQEAYRDTLLDLLRPVVIDSDYRINALGELGSGRLDESLLRFDGKSQREAFTVGNHPSCGYGMPSGMFGDDDWVTLCGIILDRGHGDPAAGRKHVIGMMQEPTILWLRQAGWPLQRLVLMETLWRDGDLARRFGLEEGWEDRFLAEQERLRGPGGPDGTIIGEMTDELVDTACGILAALGVPGNDLRDAVEQCRFRYAAHALGEGMLPFMADFPDEVLPQGRGWGSDPAFPENVAVRLDAVGRGDIAGVVRRVAALPEGPAAVAVHLEYRCLKAARKARERDQAAESADFGAPSAPGVTG